MFDNNVMKTSFGTRAIILSMLVLLILTACKPSVNFLWVSDIPTQSDAEDTRKAFDSTLKNSPIRPYRKKDTTVAKVIRVVDGSTIEVEAEGEQFLVGYVGIKTPLFEHRILGTEPYGNEAIERNRELVEGRTVILERDSFKQDDEGRRLYYVYVDDTMVNGVLVHEGLAQIESYHFALKYSDLLYELQNRAIVERNGGWRDAWHNVIPRR